MDIIVIHPSTGRPRQCMETVRDWIDNAKLNISYFLMLELRDYVDYSQYFFKAPGLHVLSNDYGSAISAINQAASYCTAYTKTNTLLVVVSDDFKSFPGWDVALVKALKGKQDFIVKTQDGIQKTLITLPIMDVQYYLRFGYIYHPDYIHMHADEEMTCVGHMLGKVIDLPLFFPHAHYSVGGMPMDAVNEKNNRTWEHGEATLRRRKAVNFGLKGCEIVKPYTDIIWH